MADKKPFEPPWYLINRPRRCGFVQKAKTATPSPQDSPGERVANWEVEEAGSKPPSPPNDTENLESAKKEYNESFEPGDHTGQSSRLPSSKTSSPLESRYDDLKVPLEEIEKKEKKQRKEENRLSKLRENWEWESLEMPEEWPRLKWIPNFDEDPRIQRAAEKTREAIEKFRKRQGLAPKCEFPFDLDPGPPESIKSAWEAVDEMRKRDEKLEISELLDDEAHEWCISLRICKERSQEQKDWSELMVYSYRFGIQRLKMKDFDIKHLGESLLIKHRKNPIDGSIEAIPIQAALPSTYLLSLKYRINKGIELRMYGILNFVDLEKDYENSMEYRTMIWTDPIGPIYLTHPERVMIRNKLIMDEAKIFAPLRICQVTIKGEFNSSIREGFHFKWTVASFAPMIEETAKDPNLSRTVWPSRVIRLDDLVKYQKPRRFGEPSKTNETWLKSVSRPDIHVFAGPNLKGIIESAGPRYAEKGVMMGYVVPRYRDKKFWNYEALIVGPARVIALITEGRYLNYLPKTLAPSIQKMNRQLRKRGKKRIENRNESTTKTTKHADERIKGIKGSSEFPFDFEN